MVQKYAVVSFARFQSQNFEVAHAKLKFSLKFGDFYKIVMTSFVCKAYCQAMTSDQAIITDNIKLATVSIVTTIESPFPSH